MFSITSFNILCSISFSWWDNIVLERKISIGGLHFAFNFPVRFLHLQVQLNGKLVHKPQPSLTWANSPNLVWVLLLIRWEFCTHIHTCIYISLYLYVYIKVFRWMGFIFIIVLTNWPTRLCKNFTLCWWFVVWGEYKVSV